MTTMTHIPWADYAYMALRYLSQLISIVPSCENTWLILSMFMSLKILLLYFHVILFGMQITIIYCNYWLSVVHVDFINTNTNSLLTDLFLRSNHTYGKRNCFPWSVKSRLIAHTFNYFFLCLSYYRIGRYLKESRFKSKWKRGFMLLWLLAQVFRIMWCIPLIYYNVHCLCRGITQLTHGLLLCMQKRKRTNVNKQTNEDVTYMW